MHDLNELILGGQRSGKSARAETLAQQWLAAAPGHRAVFIATAQPWDDEMRERIARHQQDRAIRLPGMATVEVPLALAGAIAQHSRADTLLVVDCLTLWLTHLRMPPAAAEAEENPAPARMESDEVAMLLIALQQAPGPVVLVSNEIGLGVVPLGREVRAFVDALGRLNQQVAAVCQRVTLMAAGLPLPEQAGTWTGDVVHAEDLGSDNYLFVDIGAAEPVLFAFAQGGINQLQTRRDRAQPEGDGQNDDDLELERATGRRRLGFGHVDTVTVPDGSESPGAQAVDERTTHQNADGPVEVRDVVDRSAER